MDRNAYGRINDISRLVALRKESVDRNTHHTQTIKGNIMSLSARRAWIEIFRRAPCFRCQSVALRKESVDRNLLGDCRDSVFERVALRKESVDRNSFNPQQWHLAQVALRKESVDRNLVGSINRTIDIVSLSARRAWIEMVKSSYQLQP